MYKILLTKKAIKDLDKVNEADRIRIKEKLMALINDPVSFSKKLSNPRMGTFRLRIGNYRAIFDIDDDKIIILRIGHRKDIYK